MSKSVVMIMNTLVIWERYLGSRTNGPHRPSCARYGLGKCRQVEATWACFSATWCEPSGQCSAAAGLLPAVACLHSSTSVTLSPPPHWGADPQGPWTKVPRRSPACGKSGSKGASFEESRALSRCSPEHQTEEDWLLLPALLPTPSLFQSPSVSVFGSFLTPG